MATFGGRIKELRIRLNKKQTEIAEYLDLNPRTLRLYESNQHEPSIESIIKLADFFDVSTDYLLGRSNNPKRQ